MQSNVIFPWIETPENQSESNSRFQSCVGANLFVYIWFTDRIFKYVPPHSCPLVNSFCDVQRLISVNTETTLSQFRSHHREN